MDLPKCKYKLFVFCMFNIPHADFLFQIISSTKRFLELLQTFESMPKDLVTTMEHRRALVIFKLHILSVFLNASCSFFGKAFTGAYPTGWLLLWVEIIC